MPAASSRFAELLPPPPGEWEPVAGGESGASVFVDRGRQRYAKIVSADRLTELAAERDRAELVVCHGDLCPPNILVDRATDQVTGLIDLGRLGTADPYGDISLLPATARETWSDEAMARRAHHEFAEVYGTKLDPERQDFYLRLDPLTW